MNQMEKSFSLLFYLKKSKWVKHSDEADIYLRITVNGVAKEVSTKRKVDPQNGTIALEE
jgi:Arm DNA-binding domain